MAATVAVIVFVEVLSIGAGVAIGRILWADRLAEVQVATVPVAQEVDSEVPAQETQEPDKTADSLDTALEGLTEQIESLVHRPADDNSTQQSAQSMLEMRTSLDAAVTKAYTAINEMYLGEVTRLCEELLDRTGLIQPDGEEHAFALEQLKSQAETSMNNLTLLPEGATPGDICKTIESEVGKICAQIERVKF
jgi:hypothetical protein